jgi:hypothetical protein
MIQIKIFTEDEHIVNKWLSDNYDLEIIDIKRRTIIDYNTDGTIFDMFSETIIIYEDGGKENLIKSNDKLKENWISVDYIQDVIDKMYDEKCDIRVMIKDGEFHPSLDRHDTFKYSDFKDEHILDFLMTLYDIDTLMWGRWSYLENIIKGDE